MIVDFHSHHFPRQVAVRAMSGMCRMTEGVLWPVGDGTLENHLDYLDRAGVDCAVMCPIATKPDQFEVILRYAKALAQGELGERARRKIIPFASVHPRSDKVLRQIERIAATGLKGVKFHCYYQDFSLADPSVWPMFRKIAECGLVVQCHCGADVSWRNRHGLCGPAEIDRLLKAVPELVFVAAHLGGSVGYSPHATDRLLDHGCYIDTSVLSAVWMQDEQMRILRSWPRERILFGTDFPWTHYPEAISWVKSVRKAEDWEFLFNLNARRLLKIS